jgi:class 3 adenylate cyclase
VSRRKRGALVCSVELPEAKMRPVELPETSYAKTTDGVFIAYQVVGDGPVDLAWQMGWPGNIDLEWESPLMGRWLGGLATFSRLILHDHRGVGLSSRNVALPNLETRVADLHLVLDAVAAERVVLAGEFNDGAVNALFAATDPDRARSMVWIEPSARSARASDYPWGVGPEYRAADRAALEHWGTSEYGRRFVEYQHLAGNPIPVSEAPLMSRRSRNACSPDVAQALSSIWYDTDVRGVLPSVQTPTLLLAETDPDPSSEAAYIASLMPRAELATVPGAPYSAERDDAMLEAIRGFVGVAPMVSDLDRVLAAVLFTDIVGSTERLSDVGDAEWRSILARHDERARSEIERHRGRYIDSTGDGLFATFDGPARAVRCAQAIGASVRDLGIQIRAGVHTGEVELDGDGVRGIAVHIGARVAALGGPSEVWVSQTVKDLTAGSGLTFEDRGEHELKGVPDRWHLYAVIGD